MNISQIPLAWWDDLGQWAFKAVFAGVLLGVLALLATLLRFVRAKLWILLHEQHAGGSREIRELIRDVSRDDLLGKKKNLLPTPKKPS